MFLHTVRYTEKNSRDAGETGNASPRAMMRAMLDSSAAHSRHVADPAEKQGDKWLLFQWEVEFLAVPKEGKRITAATATTGTDRLYALREFRLADEEQVYAKARTHWILVNGTTGRPKRIPAVFSERYEHSPPAWTDSPAQEPPKELEGSRRTFVAKPEHIDANDHVNNLVYIDWLLQAVPQEEQKDKKLKKLTFTYRKQVLCGDEVTVVSHWESPNRCLHRLWDEQSGAPRSWAVTEWEEES